MPKCTRLLPLFLVLFSLPALAEQGWVEVKSPHFSVITDGGEKRGRDIALRFEQMRTVFGTLFLKSKVNLPVPLQIIAFRDRKQFLAYAPPNSTGFFRRGEDRSFIVLDLSADEKWEAVFHEYAHQLLNGTVPETATWFDEGFAEYFSTLRVKDRMVEIGNPPQRAAVFQHIKPPSLLQLFKVDRSSPTYGSGGMDNQLFYAQSWAMVHYLFDKEKIPAIERYFELVNVQHVAIEDAIQQSFGMSAAQLDKEFSAYLAKNSYIMMRYPLQVTIDSSTFTARPLDPLDARVALADLRLGGNDFSAKAVQEYEEVLRLRPDDAAAHRGLGYYYLRQADYDKAMQHLQRAAQLDSKDPWVHYYTGLLMVRQATATGRPPQDVSALQQHLETAIRLKPDFADAYSLLGFADMVAGDYPSAVAHCKKAADLSPRNELYALNLARAYLATGKPVEAKALLDKLKDSSDQNVSAQVQQLYSRAERAAGEVTAEERHNIPETYDAPQWRRSQQEIEREPEKPAETATPDTRPTKYLRGQLLSVDCAAAPAATLTISSGGKTFHMLTGDTKKLLLIGADEFSCSWKNRKVLVNYKAGGKADGDLVSLEVQ